MSRLIETIQKSAIEYMREFGFESEQIDILIDKGKKDLTKALEKLEKEFAKESPSIQELSDILHAIKGVLYNLGSHDLANHINEARENLERKTTQDEIKKLLL